MTPGVQPGLDGIAPPPAPEVLLEGEVFKFAVVGRLREAVRVHVTERSLVQLVALIDQHVEHHPHALPLLVAYPWPGQDTASFATVHDDASAAASVMAAGRDVIALGYGLETGTHHKHPVLRLLGCTGLSLAARVAARIQGAH